MAPNREALKKWRALVSSDGLVGLMSVETAIDAFLSAERPKGEPAVLRDMAKAYAKIASDADRLSVDVEAVAKKRLPEVWRGQAAENASDVVTAVGHELDHTVTVNKKASAELDKLATAIQTAQTMHGNAQDPLHRAKHEVGDAGFFDFDKRKRARDIALPGMDQMLAGIEKAKLAGEAAGRQFTDFANQATASKMNSGHLSNSERLVLSQAAVPGGPHDANLILSATEAQRASQRLDQLPPGERARFEGLLANAKSPEEKAYLMSALAAGHPIDKVENFGKQINGRSPEWLRDHLQPIYQRTGPNGKVEPVMYGKQQWSQEGGTCVSMSTLAARAQVDPLYSMYLTTGGNPDDPNQTSPEAFERRLRAEEQRLHNDPDTDWVGKPDQELGPATGVDYERHDLTDSSPDQKRELVDEVTRAVDEGKPVPLQVDGPPDANGDVAYHQMMIIGHQDGMLQIYNPWGTTSWVSVDDFVNGNMSHASDGRMPNVEGVHIPK
ncbi:hypothetical protein EV193_11682 [Herbihabitans rhizosphaerae]|uniref:Peptidoglycan-binding protein n=1 Tax=Herbihabitans rhizosphaerae TaxID=1872711 RepID=A0A4Q7KFV6_9PSEU|nr:hypothetical protein [Herbihabitans rhizosphaerae]RZS30561.1 hypothetical protein EV193_11682 [Herbihabitans rhizosphaerae]